MEALCLQKNVCLWKIKKQKKVLIRKKIKQTNKKEGSKKKERVPFCQEYKKTSLVKATDTGGAPR